jgi:hypothetical protein
MNISYHRGIALMENVEHTLNSAIVCGMAVRTRTCILHVSIFMLWKELVSLDSYSSRIFQVLSKLTTHVIFIICVVTNMVTAKNFQTVHFQLVHQSK